MNELLKALLVDEAGRHAAHDLLAEAGRDDEATMLASNEPCRLVNGVIETTYARTGWNGDPDSPSVFVPVARPVAPVGYKVVGMFSDYYGSHPERGEGDLWLFIAFPYGDEREAAIRGIHLSHGRGGSNDWERHFSHINLDGLMFADEWDADDGIPFHNNPPWAEGD